MRGNAGAKSVLLKLQKMCREQTGSDSIFILDARRYEVVLEQESKDGGSICGTVKNCKTGEILGSFCIPEIQPGSGIAIRGDAAAAGKLRELLVQVSFVNCWLRSIQIQPEILRFFQDEVSEYHQRTGE